MALKPTIYRFDIALSDIDRDLYEDLNPTVAQHPSETIERMFARLLAYCLNAAEDARGGKLAFAAGLSENQQPDLWRHSLDGRIMEWIEVGEPAVNRLRKASRLAETVRVYSFNSRSDVWWRQAEGELEAMPVEVYQLPWDSIRELAALSQRTMQLSVTIARPSVFVAAELGEVEVNCTSLTSR